MFSKHITVRTGAVLFAAVFAVGATAASASADPSKAPAASAAVAKSNASKETKYCVSSTMTGSHIYRKDCRTRDQWLVRGFDPLAVKK